MLKLILSEGLPDVLLSDLSEREATLWIHRLPTEVDSAQLAKFIGLPWRSVFLGETKQQVLDALSGNESADSDLLRRRGYVQLIQTDPSLIALPPRSLPVYLLDPAISAESQFDKMLRKMAMLGTLRRSGVRRLVIISDDDGALPPELVGLIDESFRPFVTLVSATDVGHIQASEWVEADAVRPIVQLVRFTPADFVREVSARYAQVYPSQASIVRFRRQDGSTALVDLSEIDDVERPILSSYELIHERDLAVVTPEDLTEEEFVGFFDGHQTSWRPYAAGIPWLQNRDASAKLKRLLNTLDSVGASENRIAYIASEPGAGGTTVARTLAFEFARAGYPVLVAKPIAFAPDPLPMASFLTRANQASLASSDETSKQSGERPLYETPWIIVFDRVHFDRREGELRHFLNELTRSGRPAVLLSVIGPIKPLEFYDAVAREVANPTHFLASADVISLGRHLNRFLRVYKKERTAEAWSQFHHEHSVSGLGGVAAFWIALSFWLRSSRDLSGSVQDWVYRAFLGYADSLAMRRALIEIAALSSERLPLNEDLLPLSDNQWPLSSRLEDERKNLSSIGLVRVKADGEHYWGLAHDILGRLLLNALFYDFDTRVELGLREARDAEHLRFLVLKRIAVKPALAETRHRALAEQYATGIFKIDPDRGARVFAPIWREVLTALDEMPKLLRDTDRVFRHHTAISRRRIAQLDERLYGVTADDRVALLERAIEDIRYALTSIDRAPGDEPDLNLYNSLANAYLNLADVLASSGVTSTRVAELRQLANEATHRAYSDNPTNPWVVETHIKNLLSIARSSPERAAESAIEALVAVYDALRASDGNLRSAQLGRLGGDALATLFASAPSDTSVSELRTPIDVLIATWRILSRAGVSALDETLAALPSATANEALTVLSNPVGRGDLNVLRLRYGILSASGPFEFANRLALVENLQATDGRLSPQLRLEYALLLYQVGRAVEGDREFKRLRAIWRDGEHFVRVPEPLHWLREGEHEALRSVQAHVGSDQGFRPTARVSEFGNATVPFRPEEFGTRGMRPGTVFRAHVSFGYNGPFLRPTTAGPKRS